MASTVAHKGLPALEKYEILERIADGSMASVYKGRHREDGTVVAIKVPSQAAAKNAVLRERFHREFQAGSTLRHPNIVRALEFVKERSLFYLVMEYVDGPDLWKRIEEAGRLPEAEAVEVISQVGRALHEAHRHGIIHRDVKPDNVLLAPDGRALLADLGLIKDLESDAGLTMTRKGLGTPAFIAPEQFEDAKHAGVHCDVYGLAATLYMAVTGEMPFSAPTMAGVLRRKTANDLVPPRKLVPTLSERVDWAIRRALQADPDRRHTSCLEFVNALTADGPVPGPDAEVTPAAPPASRGRGKGSERRKSVRYACSLPTFCEVMTSIHPGTDGPTEAWPVTVQDLSVAGIRFTTNRRFEPHTTVTLQLQSPDRTFLKSAEMKVVHVGRTRGKLWLIGGSFVEPLTKEEVRKLV